MTGVQTCALPISSFFLFPSHDTREEKIFFVEEKTNYDKYGNSHINTTTLITGKGQTILINYYKKKEGLL